MTSFCSFCAGKSWRHASIAFLVSLGPIVAALASSCGGGDDTVANDYIGVTDAAPPRLGSSEGGTR